jgi:pimeloyl-ACP methyl ester carboxylesterase
MKTILFKIAKYVISVFILLIITGFLYEQFSRAYYDKKQPSKDEFAFVKDRKIHFSKIGNSLKGTVVFESGLGGDYMHWQELQNKLSKDYTTISYDKAGILWSDPAENISLKRYSEDLDAVLTKTNCPKPYILVGHSFAGITLRSFIKDHSQDIDGIVFVDVSHPQQLKKSSETLKKSVTPPSRIVLSFLNEVGVIRLLYTFVPFTNSVPKEHFFNENVQHYFYKIFKGLIQEMENDKKLMAEAEEINNFGSIPLTIITAKYPNGIENIKDLSLTKEYLSIHNTLQKDLLHLSVNSKQIFAEKSGHYVTLQEPELIIDAVKNISIK